MWIIRTATVLVIFSLILACAGTRQPATPAETFKTYIKALKQKDITTMKLLLSSETIRMHEQEAKVQNVTVDDIVKRETLFSEGQRTVEYRNEKIDGDKATLEVKNPSGAWETVPFVKEDDVWKIDKKGFADQIMQDMEQNDRQLDEIINKGRQP